IRIRRWGTNRRACLEKSDAVRLWKLTLNRHQAVSGKSGARSLWVGSSQAGYTSHQLGFDIPLSSAGAWGLGFAVLLLACLWVIGSVIERRKTPQARAADEGKMLDSSLSWPRDSKEAMAFAASMLIMTSGWEVLYRGFLLLLLTPMIGLPLAIVASSIAYGIGHGYKNPKQLIASIISAFVFTIAYAWTQSLWWLILIHVFIPLSSIPAVIRAQQRRNTENPLDGQVRILG
ncbi:CPBP family intramembrane glutamic endopeptidase, partial [Massilia consociata]